MKKLLVIILTLGLGISIINAGSVYVGATKVSDQEISQSDTPTFADVTTTDDIVCGDDLTVTDSVSATRFLDSSVIVISTKAATMSHAAATLTIAQGGIVLIKSTCSATITLPAASTASGLRYEISNASPTYVLNVNGTEYTVPTITIDGNASEVIDNATTNATLDVWYESLTIVCDGTEWYIISNK